jgi:hypothetical protein
MLSSLSWRSCSSVVFIIIVLAARKSRRLSKVSRMCVHQATAASAIGLLTVMCAIGQIAGPPLVAVLLRDSRTLGEGFTLSLEVAAALLAGAVLYLRVVSAYPVTKR